MHEFLMRNREELIARCKATVAQRPHRAATPEQLKNGVPLFLEQLTKTLLAESEGDVGDSLRISGGTVGDSGALSQIGVSATAHGKQLQELGYTVDQVVHDYGDLCQAITGLALERDAPFSIEDFKTLNRCLDNAIADAVTEFSAQRDATFSRRHSAQANERLGVLVHELRNLLQAARLAFTALETGLLPLAGATGGVLKRSLLTLTSVVNQAVHEVQVTEEPQFASEVFSVATFVADAANAAALDATARGCTLRTTSVDAQLQIKGPREFLLGALMNLLQNAFKFTHAATQVALTAYEADGAVYIEVEDRCGGLVPGTEEIMFRPFARGTGDGSGLGLGLSIARANVEAAGGSLNVRNLPGQGCVFTICLRSYLSGG